MPENKRSAVKPILYTWQGEITKLTSIIYSLFLFVKPIPALKSVAAFSRSTVRNYA
jgi:hypothetical protein